VTNKERAFKLNGFTEFHNEAWKEIEQALDEAEQRGMERAAEMCSSGYLNIGRVISKAIRKAAKELNEEKS